MTKILVPIDGSKLAESALPVAERQARREGATLVLLTVGELPEVSAHREEEEAALGKIVEGAAERVPPCRARCDCTSAAIRCAASSRPPKRRASITL